MDNSLKTAAEALAKAQPDHAGRSAFPPQSWRVEGQELVVLGADGRKFRGPLPLVGAGSKQKAMLNKIASDLAKDFIASSGPSGTSETSGTSPKPPVKKTDK